MPKAFSGVVAALVAVAFNPRDAGASETRLLGGKLSLQIAKGWSIDRKEAASANTLGAWRRGAAWGVVVRGTHGLSSEDLVRYKNRKVAEYSRGLSWLPNLRWLRKDVVKRGGRSWVDLRFIGLRDGAKNSRDGLLYTRFLATSYGGQLLELSFTSNTDEDPATKDAIDAMMDSVKLAKSEPPEISPGR